MKRGSPGPEDRRSFEDASAAALRTLRGHLDLDEIEAALAVYRQARARIRGWCPPPRDWMDLIKAILASEAREAAIAVMEDYVNDVEEPAPRVRLKLAQLLLNSQSRPAHALRILDDIPSGSLPDALESLRNQLRATAETMRDEGPPELEPLG